MADAEDERLVELVRSLTTCSPDGAAEAVGEARRSPSVSVDDALDVVARALVVLRRRPPDDPWGA
jgi:hypothetical protein